MSVRLAIGADFPSVTYFRGPCGEYGFVPPGVLDSLSTIDNNTFEMNLNTLRLTCASLLLLLAPLVAEATTDCNRAAHDPLTHVALPGSPFTALPSTDGCWIFVSLSAGTSTSSPGVAVLSRGDGAVSLARTVPLGGQPNGMTLTHDGKVLIVPNGVNVAFLDVQQLTGGGANPVMGYWWGTHLGALERIYATVTSDDRYVFVSDESEGTISVLDLAAARRSHFSGDALVATVAVGSAPVGLALSSDDRYLYATVQMTKTFGWPLTCRPEGNAAAAPDHTEGAVVVIDTRLAVSAPARSVVKWVRAGCNPVRVVTSPRHEVYVTARGSNALLVFPEAQLTAPGAVTAATAVSVGKSPVGVAVIEDGRKVVVTNSDRFARAASGAQSLYVLDSSRLSDTGAAPLVGVVREKGFPREIRSTADGRTLLVTNFDAGTLEIVDLTHSPWSFGQVDEDQADRTYSLRFPLTETMRCTDASTRLFDTYL